MCVEELLLEVVQCCVVELELPLEGAVGDTAMPLEHGHRVVENLLKGHRPPSLILLPPIPTFPLQGGRD